MMEGPRALGGTNGSPSPVLSSVSESLARPPRVTHHFLISGEVL
jgi:hypothetical protein